MKYIIYGLFDPRDRRLRYVGQSRNGLQQRPLQHGRAYSLAKDPNLHKVNWIRQLQSLGLTYTVEVLEQHDCADDLDDAERWNIQHYRATGCDLVNIADGGATIPLSEDARRRISARMKGRFVSRETRQRMAEAQRGSHKNLGIKRSLEQKKLLSQRNGGRPFKDQDGATYDTQGEAARILGLAQGHISRVLGGKRKSVKGYRFQYLEAA